MQKKLMHLIDRKLVSEDQLLISARDLGFLRGFAVFEFLVTYQNRPFMLDDHIRRLVNSAKLVNLHNPYKTKEIERMVCEVIKANDPSSFEKTIKIYLSGGESYDGFTPEHKSRLLLIIDKWQRLPKEAYDTGVSLMTHKHKRHLPECKTNSYLEAVRHFKTFKQKGIFEILYYDERQVYEGSRSNIFALLNGQLLTPKTDILPGITRKVLLSRLNLDVPAKEEDLSLEKLLKADEVFITKSNDEVVPVVKIDDVIIGNGKVGPVTKRTINEFSHFVESGNWL